uniref:KRAB domain-containing protein n=1 Tax=Catharus ustulatus TaxID=91951 RepID=A0A8C3TXL2_CATUS
MSFSQIHNSHPVTFEDVMDVAVRFSPQEWASLDERQKEMYRSVMEGNYEMLVSLCRATRSPLSLLSSRLSPPAPGALFPRSVHFTSAPQCLPCHKGPGIAPRI